jgi:hypothetical protein
MRIACQSIFFLAISGYSLAAQTVPEDFKFTESKRPGGSASITGNGLSAVSKVTLKAAGDGKPEVDVNFHHVGSTQLEFTVPAVAGGDYLVYLAPGNIKPIALAVASTEPQPPPERPVIDSVFPTTTYPVKSRYGFQINGQHFSPDPNEDQIEVEGQGIIEFGTRYISSSLQGQRGATASPECTPDSLQKYPCLGVTADGRRLEIMGFGRGHPYQGPLRVRVWVKNVHSEFSGSFTLSRVNHRVIVWLTFLLFSSLMYVVYRLVSHGIQGYSIAGRRYSPLAAFLIDKTTDSYSLSKFQLFAFSLVSVFAYFYVFLCRALVQWNFTFPDIPDNYPSLLAISAGTTVAAIGLTGNRGTKGGGAVYPSAADFISDGGLVVAERFQFFVWTLVACIGFVMLILMQDPAKVDGFPTFPSGLLYVMGVSAAGYLGGKAIRSPGPILKSVDLSVPQGTTDLNVSLKGENLDKIGKFRIDSALQAAVGPVNGTEQPQGPQGYCTQLDFTLSQAVGFSKGDHTLEITNRDGVGAQKIFTATPMKTTNATPISHGTTGPVILTVTNYREGSSARWLAPGASMSIEIAAAEVLFDGASTVTVTVSSGDKTGIGTLTLVSPLGGTEAASITVN